MRLRRSRGFTPRCLERVKTCDSHPHTTKWKKPTRISVQALDGNPTRNAGRLRRQHARARLPRRLESSETKQTLRILACEFQEAQRGTCRPALALFPGPYGRRAHVEEVGEDRLRGSEPVSEPSDRFRRKVAWASDLQCPRREASPGDLCAPPNVDVAPGVRRGLSRAI
jgi:hypothetical protein